MSEKKESENLTDIVQDARVGKNHLFPVFLKLEELEVLLVGGGKVGLEKLTAIVTNAPATSVLVVASEISEPVKQLAEKNHSIRLLE